MSAILTITGAKIGKEVKVSKVGSTQVATFTAATSDNIKNPTTNEWIKKTTWHNIKCFGKHAEIASNFQVGDTIEATGDLEDESFKKKTGEAVTIKVLKVVKLKRTAKKDQQQPIQTSTTPPTPQQYRQDELDPNQHQEDLPF